MERDLTSPSIATLRSIVISLGTDLTSFSQKEKTAVVFMNDYFVKEDERLKFLIR